MKFIKKSDIAILAVLLILCGGCWFAYRQIVGQKAAKAEIYYQSQLVKTVDLTSGKNGKDWRFTIPQNKNVVFHVYPDGSICFEHSDCPDKVCIHAGRLRTVGESAACLPNKIVLKIVSGGSGSTDGVDMMTG